MSYTPTEWKTGDVVTSAKLNKLEQGVADAGGGGALVVEFTYNASDTTYTSTSLASDVITAFFAGTPVMCHFPSVEDSTKELVKNVTWVSRPAEGSSGITRIGFDSSEEYITFSSIEDDHIVCLLYIPD